MAGLMKREPRGDEETADVFSRFDQMFDEWARMVPFRRWTEPRDQMRIEEYREDGMLVVRADVPGIDPDKDLTVTVSEGTLHIEAERREESKQEGKGYLRQEVRYGSASRSLPLPRGVSEADITATYKAGILEVRVPEPRREEARKIAISKS